MPIFKIIMYGSIAFAAFIAISILTIYANNTILNTTAESRGQTQERERVVADGDYRIANYDYFYRTCNDIQAKNEKIASIQAQIEATGDEATKAGLEQGLFAEQNSKIELIGDYNAKASQQNTAGQYRAAGLPSHISNDDMEVTCDPA